MTAYKADYTGQDFRSDLLTTYDFSEVVLIDAKLSYASLAKKSFKNSNLTRCQLDSADLSDTCFRYATITNANLQYANLQFSKLRSVIAEGADFSFAKLHYANLLEARLANAVFSGGSLQCADLIQADLNNADLSFTDLTEVDLTGAVLTGANLAHAKLNLVDLTDADLTGSNLTNVTGLGTKEGEIEFAHNSLREIESGDFQFDMEDWGHCLVGLAFPQEVDPEEKAALASRLYPTLAKYFHANNETALDALRKVASGKLSVFG